MKRNKYNEVVNISDKKQYAPKRFDNSKSTKTVKPKKTKQNKNGKLVKLITSGIQLLVSAVFVFYIFYTNIIPDNLVNIILIALALFLGLTFFGQMIKNRGIKVFSILMCILVTFSCGFGIYSLATTKSLLSNISNATYEVTNMIVVVRDDDIAEYLLDAVNYNFGIQTFTDTDNNDLMIEEIESVLEQSINITSYDNMTDEANALLSGEIDAAIINEGFVPLLEENIDDYADSVKIIYTYGIEIEIESTTELDDETLSTLSITEEPFNIYISGIDTSGAISNKSRSDVNIIMSVNPTTKEILLTTTPRDYYVTFPGVTGDSYDKLTHAGIYGVDVSIAALENLYDIEIDYYAKVNFTSLTTIVDALGGIEVYSEYSFYTTHLDNYYVSQGMNTMTGEQALAFVRERYAFTDGDNQRGKNQQQVIIGILNKVMSPSILTGMTSIIASVSDNVQTNMSDTEIAELIKMQINDGSSWTITTVSATGSDSNNSCYSLGGANAYVMVPDEESVESIKEQIAALFAGE